MRRLSAVRPTARPQSRPSLRRPFAMWALSKLSLYAYLGLAAVFLQGCSEEKGPSVKDSVIEMFCSDAVSTTVEGMQSKAIAALNRACSAFTGEGLDACLVSGATSINTEKADAEQKLSTECKEGIAKKIGSAHNLLKVAKHAVRVYFKKHKANVSEARKKFNQAVIDATSAAQNAMGKSGTKPKATTTAMPRSTEPKTTTTAMTSTTELNATTTVIPRATQPTATTTAIPGAKPEAKFDASGPVVPMRGMAPLRGAGLGVSLTALIGVVVACGIRCVRTRRAAPVWTLIDGSDPEDLFGEGLE